MKKSKSNLSTKAKKAASLKTKTRLEKILLAVLVVMLGVIIYLYWVSSRPQAPQSSSSTKISELAKSETNKNNTSDSDSTSASSAPASASTSSQPTTATSTTKTNASSSAPKTTTPAPAPQAVAFSISGVSAEVNPNFSFATCGSVNPYNFTANITATAAGTASYYWVRSDGARGPDTTLTFNASGTKQVNDTWTLYGGNDLGTYQISGWEKVVVTSPNSISSNNATFNMSYGCL